MVLLFKRLIQMGVRWGMNLVYRFLKKTLCDHSFPPFWLSLFCWWTSIGRNFFCLFFLKKTGHFLSLWIQVLDIMLTTAKKSEFFLLQGALCYLNIQLETQIPSQIPSYWFWSLIFLKELPDKWRPTSLNIFTYSWILSIWLVMHSKYKFDLWFLQWFLESYFLKIDKWTPVSLNIVIYSWILYIWLLFPHPLKIEK